MRKGRDVTEKKKGALGSDAAMIDVGTVVEKKFKVLRKLGEGGMGTVFEVENTGNGKRFALKTVHPHLMQSSAVISRFKDEVRASVMVESDHVVNAFDMGVDESTKTPWLLLELLQGNTLEDEICARGALGAEEAQWILEQIGAALVAAHTATPNAVVHLDLKPSNVFLAMTRTVSRERVVKVLDFGLARFIDASKTAADLTSQSGTLEWMAPEQFEVGQVRPAADVWAYGLLAFFVLTGRCFWRAANVSGSQYKSAAVLAEVIGKPIPSATARVKELCVAVTLPAGFDDWLMCCVAREESDRFKSAVECVPALLALLPRPGTSKAPPPEPAPPRGATAVGAPSVPKDLPSAERSKPPSAPPVQRTEVMRGGPPTPPPASEPSPPRAEAPQVPTRGPGARVLALAAVPLLGLAVWGLTRSSGDVPPTPRPTPVAPPPVVVPTTPVQPMGSCPEGMVYLAGGTVTMDSPAGEGQDSERPQNSVTLRPFCLGRTEVTVAAWTLTGRQPSHRESYCNYGRRDRQDHPMNCIDWTEADGYCRSLGQRLPTEAEWEFAASVGGTRRYPWGDSAPSNELCWSGVNQRIHTCTVGSFPAGNTPTEISDLSGNVWEWVSDGYDAYESDGQTNPGGANSGTPRVYRGGCWNNDDPAIVRARNRSWCAPSDWNGVLGVRCASGTR
jgi:formylglycine-generating enzyme required for sulfatase activity/tRNA A-37 threonylcarbamoyl transferase component Bud32